MTGRRVRILCLDPEGGYGGSSRSLYQSLRFLDNDRVQAEVWCRRAGPIQPLYDAIGVPVRVRPDMPTASSLPRLSRNLYVYGLALWEHLRARAFCRELAEETGKRFDLVHFNHEGLFLLARWLRRQTRVPLTMHIRKSLTDTAFARWQLRTAGRVADYVVFITENERARFREFGGRALGTVIYNIAAPSEGPVEPHPQVPSDGRFKVACLSNYSWYRGTDRLVEVAGALAAAGHRGDVLFVVAGEMSLSRSLPGALGRIGRRGGTLADYAAERGVSDMFLFLGHVSEPERVLAASDALAKPTREDNPWGRDIIEALAAGKPVLTVGSWDTFVTDGQTGILQEAFDAEALARAIVRLADDRGLAARLGAAGRERVMRLCNGPERAAELLAVWESLAKH